MTSKDEEDKDSVVLNVISFFITVFFLIWLFFDITPLYIYNKINAKVYNREHNKNATLAIESLLGYTRGATGLQHIGSVTFKNCKSESTVKFLGKKVRYSIDWNKVDWNSLAFGNFSKIKGSNEKMWRMNCLEDCEFIGRWKPLRQLVKPYSTGSFDQRVNSSMIKNHIQKIKLACSSN